MINKIQFQKGMSLIEFLKTFPDEKHCRDYLRGQKWPEGFRCRHCHYHRSSIQQKGIREVHECLSCFYQESLIAHTLFEHTRLPLRVWFLAIQLLSQAKTCMSAMELHRHLDINIKTARLLKHKIMQTLTDSEKGRILEGRIECDDAYLGGILKGGKRGRGSENKVPFIAAVQTDDCHHPKFAVLTPIKSFTRSNIKEWAHQHLNPKCCVLSDGLDCFKAFESFCQHKPYNMNIEGTTIADTEFKWVNTVLANVKTAFAGALHSFKFKKYSDRYLGNMQFRFNHRFELKNCFYKVINLASSTKPKPARLLFSDLSG